VYSVGDLVICEGDGDVYMYYADGVWEGWGCFVKMLDGSTCQLAKIMCSKY